jgi:hypothetical protein
MVFPPQLCSFLADVILVVHFVFVAFVVGGLAIIWLGRFLGWQFVRNRRFRLGHLGAMGFVLWEALAGRDCPLTLWEHDLRVLTGNGQAYPGSFVQYWLHRVLFYEASETVFCLLYALFFVLLCLSWWVVRPNRRMGPRLVSSGLSPSTRQTSR